MLGLLILAISIVDDPVRYRIDCADAVRSFTAEQLALVEKLNRADVAHLGRLPFLIIPERWDLPEAAYSPLPLAHEPYRDQPKSVVVHLPAQVFGAYEFGRLVRWGPVSSGDSSSQTPVGPYNLTWKVPGRNSTVDPTWYMRWYFNIDNAAGIALHAYALPGLPASHSCIRLLTRDARWLYDWGETWILSADEQSVVRRGTAVTILGPYRFDQRPPWRSLDWLSRPIELEIMPNEAAPCTAEPSAAIAR